MNNKKRADIAVEFAKEVCASFYSKHEVALGHDLLKISPSLQVNMLIVNELSQLWAREMDGFKSHYFNFDHEEVAEAYTAFKNIVSKHICIRRSEMEPLLKSCAENYLWWVTDFKSFAENYISNRQQIASKYIKTYAHSMQILQTEGTVLLPEENEQQMAYKLLNSDFAEVLQGWEVLIPEASVKNEDLSAPTKGDEKKKSTTTKEPSLHDKLKTAKQKPILDQLTLNQKIMFQKSLFSGNSDEMQLALKTAETLENFDQALDYISVHFAVKHKWDFESEEVSELLELLEFRFRK